LHRVPGKDIELRLLNIIPMAIVILGGPIPALLLNLVGRSSSCWTFAKVGNPGSLQQQKSEA